MGLESYLKAKPGRKICSSRALSIAGIPPSQSGNTMTT